MPRRPLPSVANQFGVFTIAQALARGWTPDALRHTVSAGHVDRLWRGVYAAPVTDDTEGRRRRRVQLAVAAAVTNAGVLLSHGSAADAFGWSWWAPWTPQGSGPRPCVCHAPDLGVTRLPGVHVHRARLGPYDRWHIGHVAVTSPARTVCDIAREHGTEAGLSAADAAAHAGDIRAVDLRNAVTQCRDWPGGRRAAPLPVLFDPRAESVLESRSRWAMPAHLIPAPLTQAVIRDAREVFIARSDFYWPELGVIGEADGLSKYRTRRDLTDEKAREDALRRLGLSVVRWGWSDLDRFDEVAARFREAVADQALRPAGPPRFRCAQDPVPAFRHRVTARTAPSWELTA